MTCIRASLPVVSAVLGALLLASGCSGPKVPTSYKAFNAKDGTVQCKYPDGWEQKGGGGNKFFSCRFQSGGAKIRIVADVAGSALGDIANVGGGGMVGDLAGAEMAEELTPVAQVHEVSIKQATEELGELDIKDTETIKTGFGDTRKSEFIAPGALGAKTHGVLVTALGLNHRIRVTCTCSESHWKAMKPVFEEVIASLDRGQAG